LAGYGGDERVRQPSSTRRTKKSACGNIGAVNAAAPKPATISCIGADMSITGRVECAGQLRVFGRIVGPLRAAGVLIGDSGAVEGDVVAQEVTSRGRISGTVRAARVRLQGHATVAGDIFHQSLAVEEFALFEGASRLFCAG
jgi:cytoskeletal protein CcmA (bactofilin family)